MKEYLIQKRPQVALKFTILLLVVTFLSVFISGLSSFIGLKPSNLYEPIKWYKLITYPFYPMGALNWYNALVMILTGYIIENRFTPKQVVLLILYCSILGGLIFIIINRNDELDIGIGGATMVSWGYCSAAIATGIRLFRDLNLFEKIIWGLCLLCLLNLSFDDFGFTVGQITVTISVFLFTIIFKPFKLSPTSVQGKAG